MQNPNRMIIALLNGSLVDAEAALVEAERRSSEALDEYKEDVTNVSETIRYYGNLHTLLEEARVALLRGSRDAHQMQQLSFKIDALKQS